MTPAESAGLQALAQALRAEADALELLAGTPVPLAVPEMPSADLTVAQVAERFGRKASTVRGWILSGRLRSYSFANREHRVTPAALQEFEAQQRSRGAQKVGRPTFSRRREVSDLSSWRKAVGS